MDDEGAKHYRHHSVGRDPQGKERNKRTACRRIVRALGSGYAFDRISGAFRSFDALVDFCRIRGYVSTARKNGLNALDALRRVFLGDPFVPAANTS